MTLHATPLAGNFAALIEGVTIDDPLAETDFERIAEAVNTWGVVVLRGQPVDPAVQVAFTRRFGPLVEMRANRHRRDDAMHRALARISNTDADGNVLPPEHPTQRFSRGNRYWHADLSYVAEGARQSVLVAHRVAASGGETEFADLAAAWDALPPDRQRLLEGLYAWHSTMYSRARYGYTDFTAEERERFAPVLQPLCRLHPATGRKVLYVGAHAGRVEGLDDAAGAELLDELLEFATGERFVYRHSWRGGDMVIWDNRRVVHRGRPSDGETPREMYRCTVVGDFKPATLQGLDPGTV